MPKALDLTNQKFSELTALRLYSQRDTHGRYWLCRCSCGQEIAVRASNLISGHTKSCGRHRRKPINGML